MQFALVVDAFAASRKWDSASLSRLAFWNECLGAHEFGAVTPEHVDEALVRLSERGRLKAGKRLTMRSGEPLAPATINRYVSTLQSIYKFARKARLLPRTFVSPATGIEKFPEPVDPDRYFNDDDVKRLRACARVVDRRWGRLSALILMAYHTGLRRGSLLALRWQQMDLIARRVVLSRTKNGSPQGVALTQVCAEELGRFTNKEPNGLVFGNRSGGPMHFDRLWDRTCAMAGLSGRVFHELRHGTGSALARSGASQAQIMAILNHRTLTASRRYMHHNVNDQQAVVDRVFG
jgi:integrase